MEINDYYSASYSQARQRFIGAAEAASAKLSCLRLDTPGPGGEVLAIDIAWLGNPAPRRVVLHSSGLHGIEGFAGSAIQVQALSRTPSLSADTALVLVHSLNPYGMAWLRRVNEANVDLNRNFPGPGQRWTGADRAYHRLDKLLNPPSPPAWDGFLIRVVGQIIQHGLASLKQAVAAGQYDYAKGLFYGGNALQQGPRCYLQWLTEHLAPVEYVLAIDVHTGLGPWGKESLFVEAQAETGSRLKTLLRTRRFTGLPYSIQGGLCAALPTALPGVHLEALTQEFGTYPVLQVLHALREENRWYHYGNGSLQHSSKRRLLRMFCPSSPNWRAAILQQGVSLLEQAVGILASQLLRH